VSASRLPSMIGRLIPKTPPNSGMRQLPLDRSEDSKGLLQRRSQLLKDLKIDEISPFLNLVRHVLDLKQCTAYASLFKHDTISGIEEL